MVHSDWLKISVNNACDWTKTKFTLAIYSGSILYTSLDQILLTFFGTPGILWALTEMHFFVVSKKIMRALPVQTILRTSGGFIYNKKFLPKV